MIDRSPYFRMMFFTLILRDRRFLGLSQSEWRRLVRFSPIATVLAVGGCDGGRNDGGGVEQGSVEWKIENAMSAAPEAIARNATIMGWPTGPSSSVTVLREGTNDWVCYPTSPNVPFDDPKCMNQAASLWSQAMGVGEVPAITTIGVGYMLSGGGTASVSDPSVREPPSGEEWRVDPPHVMLHFPPGALDSAGLPVRPDDGGPWVMWATTPWAHIMVPVGPAPESESSGPEPGTPEWNISDAMSAAPAAVSAGATVVSWAAGAGSEREVLRTGANGWTCFPGSPVTPTDDPTCGNRAWSTWFDAWASRTTPDLRAIGFSYWLKPTAAASNDDPFLLAPGPGQDWIPHPPEFSVHLPSELLEMAVFSSDQGSGGPWIMFAGTPYAHLMVPLR